MLSTKNKNGLLKKAIPHNYIIGINKEGNNS